MMRGMALSAKNVGVHYNVIRVPDFNCRDILYVFVAVSRNSLSYSVYQLMFNMIVGMKPFL